MELDVSLFHSCLDSIPAPDVHVVGSPYCTSTFHFRAFIVFSRLLREHHRSTTLYQFIFILCSISVWKSGTSRSSLPVNTSSQPISQSRPCRISRWTPLLPPRVAGLHSPASAILSSIPLRTGSAIPNCRLNISIFKRSWVSRHWVRRASSGWAD